MLFIYWNPKARHKKRRKHLQHHHFNFFGAPEDKKNEKSHPIETRNSHSRVTQFSLSVSLSLFLSLSLSFSLFLSLPCVFLLIHARTRTDISQRRGKTSHLIPRASFLIHQCFLLPWYIWNWTIFEKILLHIFWNRQGTFIHLRDLMDMRVPACRYSKQFSTEFAVKFLMMMMHPG